MTFDIQNMHANSSIRLSLDFLSEILLKWTASLPRGDNSNSSIPEMATDPVLYKMALFSTSVDFNEIGKMILMAMAVDRADIVVAFVNQQPLSKYGN